MTKIHSNPVYLKDGKTGKWKFRVVLEIDGQLKDIKRKGFATKKDAIAAVDDIVYKYKNNVDPSVEFNLDASLGIQKQEGEYGELWGITLEELYAKYNVYAQEQLKTASYRSVTDAIENHILPYFTDRDVGSLKVDEISEWKSSLAKKGYSHKYKSKIYNAFTGLINYGIKFYQLPYNIVTRVGNFKNNGPKKEMLFWSEEEFKKFIEVIHDDFYLLFFAFLYLTGLRKGEALALTWADIDFSRKEIRIVKSLNRKPPKDLKTIVYTKNLEIPTSFGWHRTKSRCYEITTPKNRASYRQILLPDNLIELLKKHYEKEMQMYDFSLNWFVFGGLLPLSDQTIRRRLNEYAHLAGVKRIRIHDLRHSHASLLINKGQNILIVSKRLGHSNITQTLNTYSHLMPNVQAQIIDAINIQI